MGSNAKPPDHVPDVNKRFRRWRRGADITMRKLAADLGVHPQFIHDIEWGLKRPSLPSAARIEAMTVRDPNGCIRIEEWGYSRQEVQDLLDCVTRRVGEPAT